MQTQRRKHLQAADLAPRGGAVLREPLIARLLLFIVGAVAPVALALASVARAGDDNDTAYVVVKAGRVLTVSGAEFSPGTIVIEDGKVSLVGGSKLEYPPSATVIDARRQTVTPGFVQPRTRYHLDGYSRSGVNGDRKAAEEVYLSQIDFGDFLRAGYTTACFIPGGTGIAGLASAYKTGGELDRVPVNDSDYLQVALRWVAKDKKTLRDALKKAEAEIQKVEKARAEWEKKRKEAADKKDKPQPDQDKDKDKPEKRAAKAPSVKPPDDDEKPEVKEEKKPEKFEPPAIDPKYRPLVDLIQKKPGASMTVQLIRASDLHHLDDVLEPYDELPYRLYLATSPQTDYDRVVDSLGRRKASVTLRPWIHYLQYTTNRYNLAARLAKAGCLVSIVPRDDTRKEILGVRERLAELIRGGLSRKTALATLTLNPAKAIGLGDRLGSIEKGKDADLTFFDGDPLDPHARVQRVMIDGEIVWTADQQP